MAQRLHTIRLLGLKFSFHNSREFFSLFKDIFVLKEYEFSSSNSSPLIIDCGSHIGMSVLYFKKKYPHASIISFEPNPMTFQLLKKNVIDNYLTTVELINAAVADHNGIIDYYIRRNGKSWGDAGIRTAWYSPATYHTIQVPTVRLSSYITEPVDLLKVDIEGMEPMVIKEIENKLKFVKEIYIEFHGNKADKDNPLDEILDILQEKHFTCTVRQPYSLVRPFAQIVDIESEEKKKMWFGMIHAEKRVEEVIPTSSDPRLNLLDRP